MKLIQRRRTMSESGSTASPVSSRSPSKQIGVSSARSSQSSRYGSMTFSASLSEPPPYHRSRSNATRKSTGASTSSGDAISVYKRAALPESPRETSPSTPALFTPEQPGRTEKKVTIQADVAEVTGKESVTAFSDAPEATPEAVVKADLETAVMRISVERRLEESTREVEELKKQLEDKACECTELKKQLEVAWELCSILRDYGTAQTSQEDLGTPATLTPASIPPRTIDAQTSSSLVSHGTSACTYAPALPSTVAPPMTAVSGGDFPASMKPVNGGDFPASMKPAVPVAHPVSAAPSKTPLVSTTYGPPRINPPPMAAVPDTHVDQVRSFPPIAGMLLSQASTSMSKQTPTSILGSNTPQVPLSNQSVDSSVLHQMSMAKVISAPSRGRQLLQSCQLPPTTTNTSQLFKSTPLLFGSGLSPAMGSSLRSMSVDEPPRAKTLRVTPLPLGVSSTCRSRAASAEPSTKVGRSHDTPVVYSAQLARSAPFSTSSTTGMHQLDHPNSRLSMLEAAVRSIQLQLGAQSSPKAGEESDAFVPAVMEKSSARSSEALLNVNLPKDDVFCC